MNVRPIALGIHVGQKQGKFHAAVGTDALAFVKIISHESHRFAVGRKRRIAFIEIIFQVIFIKTNFKRLIWNVFDRRNEHLICRRTRPIFLVARCPFHVRSARWPNQLVAKKCGRHIRAVWVGFTEGGSRKFRAIFRSISGKLTRLEVVFSRWIIGLSIIFELKFRLIVATQHHQRFAVIERNLWSDLWIQRSLRVVANCVIEFVQMKISVGKSCGNTQFFGVTLEDGFKRFCRQTVGMKFVLLIRFFDGRLGVNEKRGSHESRR